MSLSDNIWKFLFFVALKSLSGLLVSLYHSKAGFVAICLWHILHCCFSSKETTFFFLSFCFSLYMFFRFCFATLLVPIPTPNMCLEVYLQEKTVFFVGKYTSRQLGRFPKKKTSYPNNLNSWTPMIDQELCSIIQSVIIWGGSVSLFYYNFPFSLIPFQYMILILIFWE